MVINVLMMIKNGQLLAIRGSLLPAKVSDVNPKCKLPCHIDILTSMRLRYLKVNYRS